MKQGFTGVLFSSVGFSSRKRNDQINTCLCVCACVFFVVVFVFVVVVVVVVVVLFLFVCLSLLSLFFGA